jgi:hypothetical protein
VSAVQQNRDEELVFAIAQARMEMAMNFFRPPNALPGLESTPVESATQFDCGFETRELGRSKSRKFAAHGSRDANQPRQSARAFEQQTSERERISASTARSQQQGDELGVR